MNAQHLPPEALDDWLASASRELGIDDVEVPIGRILKVAADVAHGVARPAAPLSTFLLGLAVGRGSGGAVSTPAELERLSVRLTELAAAWETSGEIE